VVPQGAEVNSLPAYLHIQSIGCHILSICSRIMSVVQSTDNILTRHYLSFGRWVMVSGSAGSRSKFPASISPYSIQLRRPEAGCHILSVCTEYRRHFNSSPVYLLVGWLRSMVPAGAEVNSLPAYLHIQSSCIGPNPES
jgi:hypothetical protein